MKGAYNRRDRTLDGFSPFIPTELACGLDARMGCEAMLRSMLRAGQHYLHPQVARFRADELVPPLDGVRMGIGA